MIDLQALAEQAIITENFKLVSMSVPTKDGIKFTYNTPKQILIVVTQLGKIESVLLMNAEE